MNNSKNLLSACATKSQFEFLRTVLPTSLTPINIVMADSPLGGISNNTMSIYTTTRSELELSVSVQAVNEAIDFLDIREDLFRNNPRLTGKSVDLDGTRFEAHYGITDNLSMFARHHQHELTIDLGEIASMGQCRHLELP